MIDKQKALAALEAYKGDSKGLLGSVVMACIELIRALPEEDGLLVALPCKIGDTVYQTDGIRVYEGKVKTIVFDTGFLGFDYRAIGSSVFLTREAAEAALRAQKGDSQC